MDKRLTLLFAAFAAAAMLGGCVATTYDRTVPAASPRTGTDATVRYPGGHYELHGNGTPTYPYEWRWVPGAGTTAPVEAPLR